MKKIIFLGSIIGIIFSGCAYSISEIDTKGKNKECVRECTKTYSYSISQGNQVGLKTETLRAARDAYQICINTCE